MGVELVEINQATGVVSQQDEERELRTAVALAAAVFLCFAMEAL